MSPKTLIEHLLDLQEAASRGCIFVEGMSKGDFMADQKTQYAVVMSLQVVGEVAARLLEKHPDFAARYPQIAWSSMRGMRNRIAHGYFELNLNVVWETIDQAIPALLQKLPEVMALASRAPD